MVHSHGHIVTLLSLHPTMNDHAKSFVVGAFFGGIVGNPAEFFPRPWFHADRFHICSSRTELQKVSLFLDFLRISPSFHDLSILIGGGESGE